MYLREQYYPKRKPDRLKRPGTSDTPGIRNPDHMPGQGLLMFLLNAVVPSTVAMAMGICLVAIIMLAYGIGMRNGEAKITERYQIKPPTLEQQIGGY